MKNLIVFFAFAMVAVASASSNFPSNAPSVDKLHPACIEISNNNDLEDILNNPPRGLEDLSPDYILECIKITQVRQLLSPRKPYVDNIATCLRHPDNNNLCPYGKPFYLIAGNG